MNTSPRVRDVLVAFLRRAVLPGVLVWGVIVALGWVIVGPLAGWPAEVGVNRALVASRVPALDAVTRVWSTVNDTWWTIGSAVVFALVILALTRRWWLAVAPLLAITVESTIFVTATQVVDRSRPPVPRLDEARPTSSFPSGHAAASVALYVTVAFLATRVRSAWWRRVVVGVALVVPVLVGYARLYRGMHHLSDVVVGLLLGLWCAVAVRATLRDAQRDPDRDRDAA